MTERLIRPLRLPLALLAVSALLWGCSSAPQKPQEPEQPPQETVEIKPVLDPFTLPPSEHGAAFAEAEAALARFDWLRASAALEPLTGQISSADDYSYLQYLEARIDYLRGNPATALERLAMDSGSVNPAIRYRRLSFEQHIRALSGESLAAAQLASDILTMLPPDAVPAWRRQLWLDLQRAKTAQLHAAFAASTDPTWRAWLELALISREPAASRNAELRRWQSDNPGHVAANPLPGGLDYLLNPLPAPERVALLLPLSDRLAPAGRAVLDGYLAAWYQQRAAGAPTPQLEILDTTTYADTSAAYDEALRRGARLVIGPLHKEGVADLLARPDRSIPVLALNRVDGGLPPSGSALIQASLSADDEAARVAELAFGQGARSALLVRPSGDWGVRMEDALTRRWAQLGGNIAATAVFSTQETYSDSLKDSLGIDASRQRARGVRDMLAQNIEFTPRRRQDIDAVFLLARNGAQARSIKPLLPFHYAGGLPVYATSSIYSGVADSGNRDLNGVQLVDMPWLLGGSPALRVTLATADIDNSRYTRLNALGADAYLLQSEFSRLQAGPDALLRGNTGLLTLSPDLHLLRETSPAAFDGGVVAPR